MKSRRARNQPVISVQGSDTLTDLVQQALSLLSGYSGDRAAGSSPVEPLPSLLEQCRQMSLQASAAPPPCIRLLHHFACTGGTIISKCIAAMPNTVLLSEIDPFSRIHMPTGQRAIFSPTDLIKQLLYSRYNAPNILIAEMFLAQLNALQSNLTVRGQRLVIRDHSHSHYCTATAHGSRPTVRDLIGSRHTTLSLISVRHPIDSFLSLLNNKWVQFEPATLEEYALRYGAFLQDHPDMRTIRYEDFVEAPEAVLEDICAVLDLPFNPGGLDLISVLQMSGDSGRKDSVIAPRSRREIPGTVLEEMQGSATYAQLCDRLGYEASVR